MVLGGSVVTYRPTIVAYSGPGDIASAAAWWGLRAYSLATVETTLIRLRRDSDDAEQDFASLESGALDIASITSFKGAANLFITTLYDQVGTNHYTQGTVSLQPQLILAGLGALPVMRTDGGDRMVGASTITQAQPFTVSMVAKRTADFSSYNTVFALNVPDIQCGFDTAPNGAFIFAGVAIPAVTASDSAFHSIAFVYDGAASDINVDGNVNTVDIATSSGPSGATPQLLCKNTGTNTFDGDLTEVGLWFAALSSGQKSALSAQQHSYWGF